MKLHKKILSLIWVSIPLLSNSGYAETVSHLGLTVSAHLVGEVRVGDFQLCYQHNCIEGPAIYGAPVQMIEFQLAEQLFGNCGDFEAKKAEVTLWNATELVNPGWIAFWSCY